MPKKSTARFRAPRLSPDIHGPQGPRPAQVAVALNKVVRRQEAVPLSKVIRRKGDIVPSEVPAGAVQLKRVVRRLAPRIIKATTQEMATILTESIGVALKRVVRRVG